MNANRSKHTRSAFTELVDILGEDASPHAVNRIAKECFMRSFVLRCIMLK